MTIANYFVGYTCKAGPNIEQFLTKVKIPANYKDITKINQYEAKGIEAQKAKAAFMPVVGVITSVTILDDRGKELVSSGELGRDDAFAAVFYLGKIAREGILWGFKAINLLQILAIQSLLDKSTPADFNPLSYYKDVSLRILDPYTYLIPSAARSVVSREGLLTYLGVSQFDLVTAKGSAEAAWRMCLNGRLLGVDPAQLRYEEAGGYEFGQTEE